MNEAKKPETDETPDEEALEDAGQDTQETVAEEAAPDDGGADDDALATLQSELASMRDELLRQRAETENVRRRGEKDRADAAAYAVTKFARDMLSVADNLERALSAMPETVADDMQSLVDGMSLTQRELLNTLTQHGIERVEPEAGDKFDHNQHQAMFEVPTDDLPAGSVVQVVAAGYRIKDRLLRPAMVGVAKGASKDAAGQVDTEA